MEQPLIPVKPNFDPSLITPDLVRGLSLGTLTERYGTIGIYTRLKDSLQVRGFGDNELIHTSLQLGLALHANDVRTNGAYNDHLMRVMLHVLEDYNIKDENTIAAAPLHDSFEDHPIDLVTTLTGERPESRAHALDLGRTTLARITNDEVAEIVWTMTNPEVKDGQDKLEVYAEHTEQLVRRFPKARVNKLGDFTDNASGNHATIGLEKQRKADLKYIRLYRIHELGLFMPDSLITGPERIRALDLLSKGYARALGRLAAQPLLSA